MAVQRARAAQARGSSMSMGRDEAFFLILALALWVAVVVVATQRIHIGSASVPLWLPLAINAGIVTVAAAMLHPRMRLFGSRGDDDESVSVPRDEWERLQEIASQPLGATLAAPEPEYVEVAAPPPPAPLPVPQPVPSQSVPAAVASTAPPPAVAPPVMRVSPPAASPPPAAPLPVPEPVARPTARAPSPAPDPLGAAPAAPAPPSVVRIAPPRAVAPAPAPAAKPARSRKAAPPPTAPAPPPPAVPSTVGRTPLPPVSPPPPPPVIDDAAELDEILKLLEPSIGKLQSSTTTTRPSATDVPKKDGPCRHCGRPVRIGYDGVACDSCAGPLCLDGVVEAAKVGQPGLCPICQALAKSGARS